MGGRGQAPTGRQHQGRAPTKITTLYAIQPGEVEQPELPRREDGKAWHEMTLWWWDDVWSSPMAREYTEPDVHGLYRLSIIVDEFWNCDETRLRDRLFILTEIRLQSATFGLTPLDRSRLRWEVERGEEANKRTQARRDEERPKSPPTGGDPRGAYH